MRSMMFCKVRRPIVNNTIARRPGRRTISDQALVLSLVSLSLYVFLARSARPRGSEVNGTAAPWSVLLASCKRVCWPWNQWKYFMDGGKYAYTRIRIHPYTRTRSLYACTYTSFCVSYTTIGSFRDDRMEARPELGLCPLCLENTKRVDQSSPSGLAGSDEKDERADVRPTLFSSCVFFEIKRDRASHARFHSIAW